MKRILILILITTPIISFSQAQTIELAFTAVDNEINVQLDSIKVINQTQGCDTTLIWPDTSLSINIVSVKDLDERMGTSFRVFQNVPNPVRDQATIRLYVPEEDMVTIMVTDILGRQILVLEQRLVQGYHCLNIFPGNKMIYLFSARWRSATQTIKIINVNRNGQIKSRIEYVGNESGRSSLKSYRAFSRCNFSIGDSLLMIGYADNLETGILDQLEDSKDYIFQFATNIPCPGLPMVYYAGQLYHTIQIFNQCWLKENLNVGEMIPGSIIMSNDSIIEKYCYMDDEENCEIYGGLYLWDEMMQYVNINGTQGICPNGWHVPTDEEWKIFEGAVDSQFAIGDPEWDIHSDYRGYDVGKNLKSTTGWFDNGNGTDLFGFTAMAGGGRFNLGSFVGLESQGYFWTSTDYIINSWARSLHFYFDKTGRGFSDGFYDLGYSVRCLKND